jgi:uncharacterized membrane protein
METAQDVERLINPAPSNGIRTLRATAEMYQGPIPHPALLKQFDEIIPNGAERIFILMEQQATHRMYLEKTVIDKDNRRADGGLICGFLIAVLGLVLAAWLISSGFVVPGVIFAAGPLATLAGVFVYGTNTRKRERLEKAKIMAGRRDEQKKQSQK